MIWLGLILILIVIYFFIGDYNNKQKRKLIVEYNKQIGGLKVKYPNLTNLLENKYKMNLVRDNGEYLEYRKDFINNTNLNGYYCANLKMDYSAKKIIELSLNFIDGTTIKAIPIVVGFEDLQQSSYISPIENAFDHIHKSKQFISQIDANEKSYGNCDTTNEKVNIHNNDLSLKVDFSYREAGGEFTEEGLIRYMEQINTPGTSEYEDHQKSKIFYNLIDEFDLDKSESEFEKFIRVGANPTKLIHNYIYIVHIQYQKNKVLFDMAGIKDKYNSSVIPTYSALKMDDFNRSIFTFYQAAAYPEVIRHFHHCKYKFADVLKAISINSNLYLTKSNHLNKNGLELIIKVFKEDMNLDSEYIFESFKD